MKKLFLYQIGLFLISFILITNSYAAIDLSSILERIDKIRAPANDFTFTVQANVNNSGIVSEYLVSVQDNTKSLVYNTKPAKNKGRIILMDGRNMWIYIPTTSRSIRISPQQQLIGAASNADIARVAFSLDYEVETIINKSTNNAQLIELKLKAKEANTPYKRVILRINKDTFHPIKSEFFSISGKLLKTIEYQDYQEILNEQRPTKLVIKDNINKDNTTELTFSNYKLEKTPKEYFQPSFLNKIKNIIYNHG